VAKVKIIFRLAKTVGRNPDGSNPFSKAFLVICKHRPGLFPQASKGMGLARLKMKLIKIVL
jgi:hypothetical protein